MEITKTTDATRQEKTNVSISQKEYKALLQTEIKYNLLIASLKDNCSLTYSNSALRVNSGEDVAEIFKLLEPNDYADKLATLKILASGEDR